MNLDSCLRRDGVFSIFDADEGEYMEFDTLEELEAVYPIHHKGRYGDLHEGEESDDCRGCVRDQAEHDSNALEEAIVQREDHGV